ncbi:MAG: hypothetical protein AAFV72_24645 [Cyanobacteria bacterium J06635_1]
MTVSPPESIKVALLEGNIRISLVLAIATMGEQPADYLQGAVE